MKKKIYYPQIVLFAILFAITGCKKMDGMYKEYVVPGGLGYSGKASSPTAHPGRNRIKISWLRGADPYVTKAKIFWDNYTRSVEVTIPPTGDTISTVIEDLDERRYSFVIRTYNSKGDSSVAEELQTAAYGDDYQASLINRTIADAIQLPGGGVSIGWTSPPDASNGAIKMEFEYTNTTGVVQTRQFPADNSRTILDDWKAGSKIKYRTLYIPDSLAIDTFSTGYLQKNLLAFLRTEVFKLTPGTFNSVFTLGNRLTIFTGHSLLVYPFDNTIGRFSTQPSVADGGWNVFNLLMPWDGAYLARWNDCCGTNGNLRAYTTTNEAGSPIWNPDIRGGFEIYNILTTSRYHDLILGRNAAGELWAIPFTLNMNDTPASQFGTYVNLGTGWNQYSQIIGYEDGVLALDAAGDLWYFPITMNGGTPALGTKKLVGKGWNVFNRITPFGTDLLALDSEGSLWRYKFDVNSVWDLTD